MYMRTERAIQVKKFHRKKTPEKMNLKPNGFTSHLNQKYISIQNLTLMLTSHHNLIVTFFQVKIPTFSVNFYL